MSCHEAQTPMAFPGVSFDNAVLKCRADVDFATQFKEARSHHTGEMKAKFLKQDVTASEVVALECEKAYLFVTEDDFFRAHHVRLSSFPQLAPLVEEHRDEFGQLARGLVLQHPQYPFRTLRLRSCQNNALQNRLMEARCAVAQRTGESGADMVPRKGFVISAKELEEWQGDDC